MLLLWTAGCFAAEPTPEEPSAPTATSPAPTVPPCVAPDVETTGAPGGQASVSNERGAFAYSGQVTAKQAREVYLWENPVTAAEVAWGGQAGAGTLRLIIQDACGAEVFRDTQTGAMSQTATVMSTNSGAAGAWVLTFEFELYTGQMGLSVTSAR